MERIRHAANLCIGRAVLFGWLAIVLIMFSLSFNPAIALRVGAVLALVMSSILLVKALGASRKNPKSTEVWMYLDDRSRPRNDEAQQAFRNMMREVYARFAQAVFVVACIMFMLSIVLLGFGYEMTLPVPQRVAVEG